MKNSEEEILVGNDGFDIENEMPDRNLSIFISYKELKGFSDSQRNDLICKTYNISEEELANIIKEQDVKYK